MLSKTEVLQIAKARLKDAEILDKAKRYDGAVYLCGYAVELKLKYCICKALKWNGYPNTRKEFEEYSSFKTHNLSVLLSLSGRESKIKTGFLAEWSTVNTWDPEARYNVIGNVTKTDSQQMIHATQALLKALR